MKQKKIAKTIALGTASAALILAMGVGVLAENNRGANRLNSTKTDIMDILTDEQKEQLKKAEKEELDAALKDGSITQEQYDAQLKRIENGDAPRRIVGSSGIMQGKGPDDFCKDQEEMKAKWDALTDAQKKELQDLADQRLALELETIEKQVELGLLDRETADTMKEDVTTMHEDMKANGGSGFGGLRVYSKVVGKDDVFFEEAAPTPGAEPDAVA